MVVQKKMLRDGGGALQQHDEQQLHGDEAWMDDEVDGDDDDGEHQNDVAKEVVMAQHLDHEDFVGLRYLPILAIFDPCWFHGGDQAFVHVPMINIRHCKYYTN